ncbi:MAG: hypothetical protein M1830_003084 [Pleopsidium flavum]|nr:MAG: hypothetical protein M1830_003084 [Pleopsidium flavum]
MANSVRHNDALLDTSTTPATGTRKSRSYVQLPDRVLAYHWDTAPPTSTQLSYADSFFTTQESKLLWSASKFRTIDFGSLPEVAFLGRSNVGKSSLLNAVLRCKISHTSSKPGRTKTMNAFGVGGEDGRGNDGRLVILDMPGYGKGSREEWGKEIMKYLVGRKELRRAFLLIDALHGIKRSDEQLLAMFRQNGIPHQIILSKVDRVLLPGARLPSELAVKGRLLELETFLEKARGIVQPQARDGPPALGEILTCSAEKSVEKGKKLGISGIRWAILSATGLENPRRASSDIAVFKEQNEDDGND